MSVLKSTISPEKKKKKRQVEEIWSLLSSQEHKVQYCSSGESSYKIREKLEACQLQLLLFIRDLNIYKKLYRNKPDNEQQK